jgi:diguanylate cyclase (GGDEF)-like protein/PAS domain S-box-containing protein
MQPGSTEWWRGALDAAPEAIAVCAAQQRDQPLVYANLAFERLSGYALSELLGQDLRCLQSWDRDQEGRGPLRDAIARGEGCRVLLRNYRKDGTQFWNELLLHPLRDPAGTLTHFAGYHRDVTERERSGLIRGPGRPSWLREDRLSGLYSRAYFEELLQHDWQVGAREGRVLTLMVFDIDQLGSYNETYGRAAGDACIRRVAGVIGGSFRRGADVVARWEGGRIVALVRNADQPSLKGFAATVAHKVLGQHIHHPHSTLQKFVSVSIGAAHGSPVAGEGPEALIRSAMQALARAKEERGESRVAVSAQAQSD